MHRRDRDDGAFAGDPRDHFHHFELAADVERARRFVEEQDVRLAHERLRDADELALATGKLGRSGARRVRRARGRERVSTAARSRRLRAGRCRRAHALSREEHGLEDGRARRALQDPATGGRRGASARASLSRARSPPSRRKRPLSGRAGPAMQRNSVDLPEPFGPTSAVTAPRSKGPALRSVEDRERAVRKARASMARDIVMLPGLRMDRMRLMKNGTPMSAVMMPIG